MDDFRMQKAVKEANRRPEWGVTAAGPTSTRVVGCKEVRDLENRPAWWQRAGGLTLLGWGGA